MRRVLVSLAVIILAAGCGVLQGDSGGQPGPVVTVIQVPVIVTATADPNATPQVIIVTATPLPGSIGALPTGILETGQPGTQAAAPTLDPEVLGANAALQQTATALPANCILHTLEAGDTPFGIAEIYGASGFDVMEINGLSEETATGLQIGDVLIVPLEGCPLTRADVVPETTADAEAAAESTAETTAETTAEAADGAAARPTLTLAPTAVNAQVEIVNVLNPGDITAEGVEIRNRGGAVDLNGWTLSDGDGNTFTFPAQRVFTNAQITVFTRAGQNTPIALHWGQRAAVFGEPGDVVTLANANGVVQSTFRIEQPVNLP
ncbi:MAG: hypothetical protein BroJett033_1130 [Chloroflexota bacterium]|nr:MAG: hypothetical protein BroJett033_1130 [Chloroflexota bacterium]